jgi:hypothetical protein
MSDHEDPTKAIGERAELYNTVVDEIDELVATSRPHFEACKEKVRPFGAQRERRDEAVTQANQLRAELWQRAKKEPRLQDKAAGPPKDRWEWDPEWFDRAELPPGTGPDDEVPARYIQQIIAAIKKRIRELKDERKGLKKGSDEYLRRGHEVGLLSDDLKELQASYDHLTPAEQETAWLRAPVRSKRTGAVCPGFVWHRWLNLDAEEVYGCWRPHLEIPDEPWNSLIRVEDTSTGLASKDLPELDEDKELERCYAIVASIYDNMTRGGERLTADWPPELQKSVWRVLSVDRQYGPTATYIRKALRRVKGDLKKLNGAPPARGPGVEGTTKTSQPAVTLIEFMRDYCEGDYGKSKLQSWKQSLLAASRSSESRVKLPKPVGKWKSGRPKRFHATALVQKWAKFRIELPFLPGLKPERTA